MLTDREETKRRFGRDQVNITINWGLPYLKVLVFFSDESN
jgi:hypothetical protein